MNNFLKIAMFVLLCACFAAAQTPATPPAAGQSPAAQPPVAGQPPTAQTPAASTMPSTSQAPATSDIKKPMLEFANANSAKIAWISADNQSENLGMHYGTSPTSLTGAVDAIENTSGKGHRASLVNLQPNTTYYVQMTTSTGQPVGPTYTFKTPAQGQPAIHQQPLGQQ
ncbi:MAG TPA: fibronectin type III domain-containing protein [Candidatus Angelobacter sp.]|jgi:flagellar capping protein FliD